MARSSPRASEVRVMGIDVPLLLPASVAAVPVLPLTAPQSRFNSTALTAFRLKMPGGQWQRALKVLDKMKKEGVLPNLITYAPPHTAPPLPSPVVAALALKACCCCCCCCCAALSGRVAALDLLPPTSRSALTNPPSAPLQVQRRHLRVRKVGQVGAGAGPAQRDENRGNRTRQHHLYHRPRGLPERRTMGGGGRGRCRP